LTNIFGVINHFFLTKLQLNQPCVIA